MKCVLLSWRVMCLGVFLFSLISLPLATSFAAQNVAAQGGKANVKAQNAADRGYLKEMPDPARVLADMQSSDTLDTAAKQWGALYQLKLIIMTLSDGRTQQTVQEQKLHKMYSDAMGRIEEPKFDDDETRRLGMNSPRAKWYGRRTDYEVDESFRNELLQRYFSPQFQAHFHNVENAQDQRLATYQSQERSRARQEARQGATGFTAVQYFIEDNSQWIIVLTTYAGLLLGAMTFRLRGRSELDSSDPRKLYAGNSHYKLYSTAGTVLSPTKNLEVITTVSGGGGTAQYPQPISSSTTTITHLQFFIKDATGKETAIQLTDLDLALRDGQQLSAVWAIREGESSGHYILFWNHSTGQISYSDRVLRGMLIPRAGLRRFIVFILSLPLILLPYIPYLIVRQLVINKRLVRVKQQISEKLIPQLH